MATGSLEGQAALPDLSLRCRGSGGLGALCTLIRKRADCPGEYTEKAVERFGAFERVGAGPRRSRLAFFGQA